MGLLSALLARLSPGYRRAEAIASAGSGRVELVGVIEAHEDSAPLLCPITGAPAVAVHYRAHAPGVTSRAYGIAGDGLDVTVTRREQRDFLLRDASGAALIRVDPGDDVLGFHEAMIERHGLELRAESERLIAGERVVVRGTLLQRVGTGDPHRRGPYLMVVRADTIRRTEGSGHGARYGLGEDN